MAECPPPRGCLIALEGIDGSGTTTQARRLTTALNAAYGSTEGQPAAEFTCEPSNGQVGGLLRQILAHQAQMPAAATALLFAADRLDHVHNCIEPCLHRGVHVVTDRYVYSSLAYQSIQQDTNWVFDINALAPEPDITIYLRIGPKTAESRRAGRGGDAELYESLDLQGQIARRYDELLGSDPSRGTWQHAAGWQRRGPQRSTLGRQGDVAVLDAAQTIDALQRSIANLAMAVIAHRRGAEAVAS